MPQGLFIHLDSATLSELKTDYVAALKAIAVGNQSYSIAGRTFTRANLREVSDTLAEIAYAVQLKSGSLVRTVRADMSC
jgi:hypothetical protein